MTDRASHAVRSIDGFVDILKQLIEDFTVLRSDILSGQYVHIVATVSVS